MSERVEVSAPIPPAVELSEKDIAQAVFYSLTVVDEIKRELGLEV